jgi:arabinose-5-phosphate isomerase
MEFTLLQKLFAAQKKYVENFFNTVDLSKAQQVVDMLLECRGSIFFFGVGKSGIIAEKLAMTMVSTGTKAFYLPVVNILHGDIGILTPEDLCIFISKSGETLELLEILPYVKEKQARTMAWVSSEHSSLEKKCDLSIKLPVEQELCPFGLAPTTSAAIQLVFGDIVAVALMEQKAFTLQDYAKNHPAGSIGTKITQTVEEVMISGERLPICKTHDKLKDVLVEFSNKRCGCLVIVDDEKNVQGIFTDGDLRRALQEKPSLILEEMMHNLMTKKFLSIEKHQLVHEAAQVMQQDQNRRVLVLPVIQQEKLVGLVHMHDIVKVNL